VVIDTPWAECCFLLFTIFPRKLLCSAHIAWPILQASLLLSSWLFSLTNTNTKRLKRC
jgi:hypothetical protein